MLAYWFARDGHRRLDAAVSDLWLFAVGVPGPLIVGVLLLPNPAPSALQRALLIAAAALASGWIAYASGAEPVRSALSGGRE